MGKQGGLDQQCGATLASRGEDLAHREEKGLGQQGEEWANWGRREWSTWMRIGPTAEALGQQWGGLGQQGEGGIGNREEDWANREEDRLGNGRRDWATGGIRIGATCSRRIAPGESRIGSGNY